jgi:hypothetical protein
MNSGSSDSNYSDEETARRRDDALLRALNTPPKQHKDMKVGKHKAKVSPKASRPKKGGRPRKEKESG